MRASAIEFRLRMVILVVLVGLGFWAPWIQAWDLGKRVPLLEWLALELSRSGIMTFSSATPVVIAAAALLAAAGMVLRVWGSASLGYGTVQHGEMQAGSVISSGPYRYTRNPLYLGTWCMIAALSFLMPPTGALFCMVLISFFLLRLILGEEAYLASRLGEPYRQYLRAVPRLMPRLRTTLPAGHNKPRWLQAMLTEINPIGIFITMAFLSWSYNNDLMLKAILVSFGVSLVARGFTWRQTAHTDAA